MATEAARLEDKELTGRKKKNRLDSHRPSHGRTWSISSEQGTVFYAVSGDRKTNDYGVCFLESCRQLGS